MPERNNDVLLWKKKQIIEGRTIRPFLPITEEVMGGMNAPRNENQHSPTNNEKGESSVVVLTNATSRQKLEEGEPPIDVFRPGYLWVRKDR